MPRKEHLNTDITQLTITELLRQFKPATGVLLQLRTGCVGCPLASFCTLTDTAREYQLSLADLEKAVLK